VSTRVVPIITAIRRYL